MGIRKIREDRYLSNTGYIFIYVPGLGRIAEHRHVMQNKLERKLRRGEHVHHIDRNKENNHPDNLEVLTSSEHSTLHGWERKGKKHKKKIKKIIKAVKAKENKNKFIIVPKQKLPRGTYYHINIGIAEKRRKKK